jgi:hypothetical protein
LLFSAYAFKIISTTASSDSGVEMEVVGVARGVGVRLEAQVPLGELAIED